VAASRQVAEWFVLLRILVRIWTVFVVPIIRANRKSRSDVAAPAGGGESRSQQFVKRLCISLQRGYEAIYGRLGEARNFAVSLLFTLVFLSSGIYVTLTHGTPGYAELVAQERQFELDADPWLARVSTEDLHKAAEEDCVSVPPGHPGDQGQVTCFPKYHGVYDQIREAIGNLPVKLRDAAPTRVDRERLALVRLLRGTYVDPRPMWGAIASWIIYCVVIDFAGMLIALAILAGLRAMQLRPLLLAAAVALAAVPALFEANLLPLAHLWRGDSEAYSLFAWQIPLALVAFALGFAMMFVFKIEGIDREDRIARVLVKVFGGLTCAAVAFASWWWIRPRLHWPTMPSLHTDGRLNIGALLFVAGPIAPLAVFETVLFAALISGLMPRAMRKGLGWYWRVLVSDSKGGWLALSVITLGVVEIVYMSWDWILKYH
jgi:hypothetical protein